MVQSSQATAGHQYHRQLPLGHLLDLKPVPSQRHEQPPGGFNHQRPRNLGKDKTLWLDTPAVQFGGPVGRNGFAEPVTLRANALSGKGKQGLDPTAVAAVLDAALYRLPVVGAKSLHEQGAHHGFAHIGIGAANNQLGFARAHVLI